MAISKFLDPKNDIAFRRIFGSEKNKDILIHFINDILELKGTDIIKEVTFLSPIQDPEIASKKQSIVDVLCKNEDGTQIIVEMQVSPQEGFEKRAQYYAAKAYSRQLNRGKKEGARYVDLKAVIFIAIIDNIIFKDKIFYKSDHIILDRDSYAHDLKDFSFTFIELPKFKITDISLLTNLLEKWCYFFKHADETSEADLQKIIGSDAVIERAYEELNQYNWTELELLTYDQEIKRIMDNRAVEDYKNKQFKQEMMEAEARAVEAEARAVEAEARAVEAETRAVEAKARGGARGEAEAIRTVAKKMLKKYKPIDEIVEFTGLSKKELESL
ncbi:Rpn family recombination-promoting nuclease/putative transposase [Candidatus Cardinium hertigii]|jgi:predicted transposase/invertase (TIGR01784 family)|uniref:Rpn family recombination-promoting nuclease/putative transposase n=1 Tax=Candidatus Cardinium hertigii TaxID=247481 RepID=A0A3N2QB19_9BACT|nr:Rpn family recombination-promoting nuclease/putative transposase [Candidatus Cardinium hertigii]ROT46997.1 Rpn family recombination-promoting nuclease/putative transposase [Candidatus Cardinium hertigii]